jgi:hypothetical protein
MPRLEAMQPTGLKQDYAIAESAKNKFAGVANCRWFGQGDL